MLTLNDGRSELWQWDTGRTLAVDADCSQVHFSNKVFGRSIDVDVSDGVAIIPDVLLQTDKDLNVWAFVGTAENGYTKISKTFKVNRRNKPSDYVFTPQEQITLKDATAILEEAKDLANVAMETAKKAEANADKAAKIADEMTRLADKVEQNTETATKAKADALIAQTKAEEARSAAETARKAAEDAENNAGVDASAASSAANRAESAASDAMNVLADIQSLYQTMQEYASQAIQNVQTEGDTQVQRVADEGAAQTAAAKGQADRAQSEADRAEAARAKAEDVVESCIPDDAAVDGKPWTSKKIVDSLCQPFEESGNPVQVYPVENYPLGVKVSWEPMQEGSGDPSPDNIRLITGRDAVSVTRCGKNILYLDIDTFNQTGFWDKGKIINPYLNRIKFKPNTQYTISLNATLLEGSNAVAYLMIYYTNGTSTTYDDSVIVDARIGKDGTNVITSHKGKSIKRMGFVPGNSGLFTLNSIQIEEGATPTTYEQYNGDTYNIALPETVYGGKVDAVTGEGQEKWRMRVLDGTEPWGAYKIPDGRIRWYWNVGMRIVENLCLSNVYKSVTSMDTYRGIEGISTQNVQIILLDSRHAADTTSEWKAYLAAQYAAGTPVQVCYKMKEPVPFTATGTQTIPALSGMNTLFTDADGVVVTGAEDPKHTITELKNAIISLGGNV